jgi:CyaY protein
VLSVTFPNQSRIIINSQEPLQEIWVAARAGGWHFKRQNDEWRDTKNGQELFAALAIYASQQAGVELSLGRHGAI